MTNSESEYPLSPEASRGRLVLALFIDFCFFSAFLGLVHVIFPNVIRAVLSRTTGILIFFILMLILEWICIRIFKRRTPGQYALSILLNPQQGMSIFDLQFFLVVKDIKEREHWLTLFFGVYLINEGCKQIFRLVNHHSFPPIFNMELPQHWDIVFLVGISIFSIQVGIDILRLRKWSFYAAIAYFLIMTFGYLLGHEQVIEWFQNQIVQTGQHQAPPHATKHLVQMLVSAIEYSGVIFAGLLYINKDRFKQED